MDKGNWPKLIVVCLSIIMMLFLYDQADARKKRKRFISPVKVEEVVTTPNPFIIGQTPLTLSIMVKVPLSSVEDKVLEVTALITSPTRRSMSFVSQRQPLATLTQGGLLGQVPVDLVWDGKDQYENLIADGSYFYEIQAKVMEDEGYGPRTKMVSHRVQGTLEALAYAGEVLPPIPPEPEVPAEIEALQQEELAAQDLSLGESEVSVEENGALSSEEVIVDEVGQGLEGSSGGESVPEPLNENSEDLVPVLPSEGILKGDSSEFISDELGIPMKNQSTEPPSEPPLEAIPTESSVPSSEHSSRN